MMHSAVLQLVRLLLHRYTRYALAWLIALNVAGLTMLRAWVAFEPDHHADGTPVRPGGNYGHVTIDLGGQWTLGHLLARGWGRHLYHRSYQWQALWAAYPRSDEIPPEEQKPEDQGRHDAENLMAWFMGDDDPRTAQAIASVALPLAATTPYEALVLARVEQERVPERITETQRTQIGGPLYPPVHALFMAPLGLLRPHDAYRVIQFLDLILALVAAGGIGVLSQGRIWWPVAFAGIVLYPGFSSCVNLGQNSVVALAILIWGWVLLSRSRPFQAGAVWGFLAFKPVWALAFLLVPLVTRRWRFCAGMVLSGGLLVLATLPFVGWRCWLDWLHVGSMATTLYKTDQNWIFLSRDVLSFPRRWLLEFPNPSPSEGVDTAASLIGWMFLLAALEVTVRLAVLRPSQARAITGPAAACLLLGAWLWCFHFMFYDVLLTALPVFLLLTEPRRYLQPVYVVLSIVPASRLGTDVVRYHALRPPENYPGASPLYRLSIRNIAVRNSMTLSLLVLFAIAGLLVPTLGVSASVSFAGVNQAVIPQPLKYSTGMMGTPWDTFCLIALWLWCGWLWLKLPSASGEDSSVTRRVAVTATPKLVELSAGIDGPHERLADEHRPDSRRLQT
jgi:hypothetical protein